MNAHTVNSAQGIAGLISLVLGIFVLVWLPVWIATLAWVWRDARRCGKSALLATLSVLLIGLIMWPVGLLVWLILRKVWRPKAAPTPPPPPTPPLVQGACPHCGQRLAPGTAQGLCPACLLRQAAQDSAASGPGLAGFTPPPLQELAALLPHLEIQQLLGRGGMGAVYKAKQRSLDRVVALKILPAEAEADPAFAERFRREARALAQLSHQNIVGIHDFGQAGKFAYFVMEYVDGVNLRQLQRAGRLSPRETLAIVPQICEALQFAHDRGVVHRDIKPENIMVDAQGRVKIADFGLAKLMRAEAGGAELTLTRQAMGTPQYMAPEQVEKPQSVDHRADIYSLGVVFYEMLTGELPLGRFAPPSQKVQVDVRLDEIVLKTLEKEPELRYQQAGEVKTQVETMGGEPAPAASSSPLPPDEPPSTPPGKPSADIIHGGPGKHVGRKGWVVGLLVLLLAVLAFPGLWTIQGMRFVRDAERKGLAVNVEVQLDGFGYSVQPSPSVAEGAWDEELYAKLGGTRFDHATGAWTQWTPSSHIQDTYGVREGLSGFFFALGTKLK